MAARQKLQSNAQEKTQEDSLLGTLASREPSRPL
jgi:hypothetical protein